jgi:putative transposase
LSKSTVSRVCEAIKDEFDRWSARRLDEVELDYLFLDGSCFKLHPGARAQPVLAAWGITTAGQPVFLGLAPGGSESTDAWSDVLEELKGRGLRSPLLIIADGAGGLINAAETSFARSLRQRCLIHQARNLLAKVPAHAQGQVKAADWQVFDTDDVDLEPGPSWWRWCRPASTPSPSTTGPATPRQSSACLPTASSSPPTCASRPSTTRGSVTPTSSSAPSGRPADA